MEKYTQPSTQRSQASYLLMAFGCFTLLSNSAWAQGSFSRADDYPFLHPEANVIQWYSDSALIHVREAWNNADSNAFVIAHFGDEHIQADMFLSLIHI